MLSRPYIGYIGVIKGLFCITVIWGIYWVYRDDTVDILGISGILEKRKWKLLYIIIQSKSLV